MKKIFTLVLFCLGVSAFAQTTLMENFIFSGNDTLAAQSVNNGWINTASPALLTNAIRATGTPLTYTGYTGSGLGSSVPLTTSGQDILKDGKVSYTSGNVYASFLLRVTAAQTGDYFFGLLPQTSTTAFTARTFLKLQSTGYYKVGIMKGSTTLEPVTAYSTDSFAFNTTYLMVVKYEIISGITNDSCKVYMFSSGIPSTEPTMAAVSTVGGTNVDATAIGRVLLRQGSSSASPTLTIGNLRLSPIWANGPLPVEFSGFKGTILNNTVNLDWNTSSEISNKGFEVERSFNGNEFESIGFVKGAGNSNKLLSYQFNDENARFPVTFYRLKQIDFDGKFDYSSIISISNDENKIEITPNPFVETVNIQALNQDQFVSAEIIDITGKVKASLSGKGNLTMDTKDLSQGIYFIRINNSEKVIVKRIIKN